MAERTTLAQWVKLAKDLDMELRSAAGATPGEPPREVLLRRTQLLWDLSGRIDDALPELPVRCEYDELMAVMAQVFNVERQFLADLAVNIPSSG